MARLDNQQTDDGLTGEQFRWLVDHSPDAICVLKDGCLVYVNAAAVRSMAAETSEHLVGRHITEFVNPEAIPPMWAGIAALQKLGDASNPTEAQILRSDATTLTVEAVWVLTVWDDEPAYQVVFRDVSAHDTLRRAESRFEAVVQALDDGVVVMRNDGHIKFINPAAMRILGLEPEDRAGDFATMATTLPICDAEGKPVPTELRPAELALRTGVAFSRQVYGTDLPNGERRWLLASGRMMKPAAPAPSDLLISFSDITADRVAMEGLIHQANHDPLTELPNRGFVLRRITEALAATDGAQLRAVLFIDLDDLKSTNDTLGHKAGDDLLRAAAARLREAVGPGDVVGRHGGDEFVVLIFGAATRGKLDGLADRLRILLAEPVAVGSTAIPIRASVGIVKVRRGDKRTAEEILRDADRAMYKAKRASRGHDPP